MPERQGRREIRQSNKMPDSKIMSIVLEHINYTYGKKTSEEKRALDDINLEIKEGEILSIVGHTGCGKSTLIQILNGLLKPESGTVLYHGQNIHDKGFSLQELRGKVGLVFQYPEQQLFEASVIKDVQFGPKNLGWAQLDVELSAFQALKDVGIGEDLLDVSPLSLSGGQKRRVAIAGVLAMHPEILILDEPMAGLDPAGRKEIFELLIKLHKERGITVVFVSHSMEDAAVYADRMVVMNEGKIVLQGEPRKIFHYETELQQIGLGIPQTTVLMNRLAEAGAKVSQDCITVEESIAEIIRWIEKEKKNRL